MEQSLGFFDRLLGRKEKSVLNRDENGNITGRTTYTYDDYNHVVAKANDTFDSSCGEFRRHKDKTYVRTASGDYEPEKSIYYDNKERVAREKFYSRDDTGMLCCTEDVYGYIGGRQKLLSDASYSFDGGLWTPRSKKEFDYDRSGQVIRQGTWAFSSKTGGLVCTKEKTFERNEDGHYDPKETIYRVMQNRVSVHKKYHREQTELAEKPILFGEETVYDYSGKEPTTTTTKRFHMGGNFWGTMEEFEAAVEGARKAKENASKSAGEEQKTDTIDRRLQEVLGDTR